MPTFAELVDRLSIHQLKEVLLPDQKEKYGREMQDIEHDIDLIIKEGKVEITGHLIRCIIALAQINEHIWYNESKVRRGESQDLSLLKLTHGLNGLRNRLMNEILAVIGQAKRQDPKTDCLAAEFKDWNMSVLGQSAV